MVIYNYAIIIKINYLFVHAFSVIIPTIFETQISIHFIDNRWVNNRYIGYCVGVRTIHQANDKLIVTHALFGCSIIVKKTTTCKCLGKFLP